MEGVSWFSSDSTLLLFRSLAKRNEFSAIIELPTLFQLKTTTITVNEWMPRWAVEPLWMRSMEQLHLKETPTWHSAHSAIVFFTLQPHFFVKILAGSQVFSGAQIMNVVIVGNITIFWSFLFNPSIKYMSPIFTIIFSHCNWIRYFFNAMTTNMMSISQFLSKRQHIFQHVISSILWRMQRSNWFNP